VEAKPIRELREVQEAEFSGDDFDSFLALGEPLLGPFEFALLQEAARSGAIIGGEASGKGRDAQAEVA